MLIFENISMFEAIYDTAKKIYPELVDAMILVGYTDSKAGVLLLEGTDEDEGKYKIALNPSEDPKLTATYFMSGIAMTVYREKYGKYVHPLSQDEDFKPDDRYQTIMDTIAKAFEDVPYDGEYAHV